MKMYIIIDHYAYDYFSFHVLIFPKVATICYLILRTHLIFEYGDMLLKIIEDLLFVKGYKKIWLIKAGKRNRVFTEEANKPPTRNWNVSNYLMSIKIRVDETSLERMDLLSKIAGKGKRLGKPKTIF